MHQDCKSLPELACSRVAAERHHEFEAEARRQCLRIADRARDPTSDEAAVMRWIGDVADTAGWEA